MPFEPTPVPVPVPGRLTRRALIASLLTGAGVARASWRAEDPLDPFRRRAEVLGLRPLRERTTEHYVGLGDADERFLATALKLCEGLADDYLDHLRARGFGVERPTGPMAVVVLSSPEALARFVELPVGTEVRGVYDLDSNYLAFCDNRAERNPAAERANTVTLFHEATHQLTFNTGLLDRAADVPAAVSEGLGTYGETRRPDGRRKIGARNPERLAVLAALGRDGGKLIPAERFLVEDALFDEPDTQQVAYSQSWLLVHRLMQPDRVERFRTYLDNQKTQRDPAARLDGAREHLGDLGRLDRDLAAHANRLLR